MAYLRRAALAALAMFTGLATQAAMPAQAEELPALLEHALVQGEVANRLRWAYTSTFNNEELDLTFRFMPNARRGTFTLLAPDAGALSEEERQEFYRLRQDQDPDADLTHEQARAVLGDQGVRVLEDTPTHITYGARPGPWDDLDSDEARMIEHLMAELTVSKQTGQVSQIRLYNFESFNAMLVARVESFEQVMTFAPEPITGLPLMTTYRQEIRGRALFSEVYRLREENYRDYRPMRLDGTAVACAGATCTSEFMAPE